MMQQLINIFWEGLVLLGATFLSIIASFYFQFGSPNVNPGVGRLCGLGARHRQRQLMWSNFADESHWLGAWRVDPLWPRTSRTPNSGGWVDLGWMYQYVSIIKPNLETNVWRLTCFFVWWSSHPWTQPCRRTTVWGKARIKRWPNSAQWLSFATGFLSLLPVFNCSLCQTCNLFHKW